MRVFVDVDVQNDFCNERGALYVPGSPNDLYRALVRHAQRERIPILGSVDSHAFDAWEFASNTNLGPNRENPRFPDHCVKGTWGWLKVDGTLPARFRFVPNVACDVGARAVEAAAVMDPGRLVLELVHGEAQALYFEKEVYSLFVNPNAEKVLGALADAAGALELVVFGVATDYCVRAAALGLRERGYSTLLVTDAIRGITTAGSQAAMAEMGAAGVRFVTSSDLGIA